MWISPFNPETGSNFQKNLGFIEGNSWQYTFMLAHDTKGLNKLNGWRRGILQNSYRKFLRYWTV